MRQKSRVAVTLRCPGIRLCREIPPKKHTLLAAGQVRMMIPLGQRVGLELAATTPELHSPPEHHNVPQDAVAIRLAPDHFPSVKEGAQLQFVAHYQELGFDRVKGLSGVHGHHSWLWCRSTSKGLLLDIRACAPELQVENCRHRQGFLLNCFSRDHARIGWTQRGPAFPVGPAKC